MKNYKWQLMSNNILLKDKNNLIADLNRKSDKEKEMLVNQYEQKLANLQDIINNEREKARLRTSQIS